MQPVLGIANPPLAQRPLLQLTPQPLAANPQGQYPALYPSLHAEGHNSATVGESGPGGVMGVPILPLQDTGLGDTVLFVSHSSPSPNLACTGQGSCVSGRG